MAKRGRGRPKLDAAKRKGAPIGVRVSHELRERLVDAATQAGRTLSQEAEARLKQSFDDQQKISEFGGLTNYWLFLTIAEGIAVVQARTKHEWWSDRYTFDACRALLIGAWDRFKPRGRRTMPKGLSENADELGLRMAGALLASLELALEGQEGLGRAGQAAALAVGTKVKARALPALRAKVAQSLGSLDRTLQGLEKAPREKRTLRGWIERAKEEEGK
jgi:hypothetical protein